MIHHYPTLGSGTKVIFIFYSVKITVACFLFAGFFRCTACFIYHFSSRGFRTTVEDIDYPIFVIIAYGFFVCYLLFATAEFIDCNPGKRVGAFVNFIGNTVEVTVNFFLGTTQWVNIDSRWGVWTLINDIWYAIKILVLIYHGASVFIYLLSWWGIRTGIKLVIHTILIKVFYFFFLRCRTAVFIYLLICWGFRTNINDINYPVFIGILDIGFISALFHTTTFRVNCCTGFSIGASVNKVNHSIVVLIVGWATFSTL